MKQLLKSLSLAAAIAVTATAQAAPTPSYVNIGGLMVPTGVHFEVMSIYENAIGAVGDELRGVGEVSQINGQAVSSLCTNCELTYTFDNYIVTSLSSSEVKFSGGVMKFYLGFGSNNDFNPFLSANYASDVVAASNGTLFMTLAGHAVDSLGNTFIGGGTNINLPSAAGTGSGLADVVVGAGLGIAQSNFDTNSIETLFVNDYTDFQIGSSFSNVFTPHCTGAPLYNGCLSGSVDMRGLVIPEPESVALFGVGLLALVATTKRRRHLS